VATEIILIRHGHTVPVNGDYAHAPLTELGREQAAKTGQYLAAQQRLDAFFSSTVRRARETAAIIGEKIGETPAVKTGIQEIEGLEVPLLAACEVLSIFDPVEDYLDDHAGKPIRWPLEGRVANALLEIVTGYPGQQVAVVTHSGVISSVLAWLFPEQRLKWWLTTVNNCSFTRFRVENARFELTDLNDTQHLQPQEMTAQPPSATVQATKQVMKTIEPPRKAVRFGGSNQSKS